MAGKTKYPIKRQPDDITCGPTCLHSVYEYYGDSTELNTVINSVKMLKGGGTLGALLGTHALKRGYEVSLYTYNLKIFDPTWFQPRLSNEDLIKKLKQQAKVKKGTKLRVAIKAYISFLKLGGEVQFADLSPSLLRSYLTQGIPIVSGLSATYLYKSMREYGKYPVSDDVRGEPQGHFVVLTSYDTEQDTVKVADPYHPESLEEAQVYRINVEHLVNAILLGVMTYDGNLIVITKK